MKNSMTIQEAILKTLEGASESLSSVQIYQLMKSNGFYDFGTAPTPVNTVSSRVGDFIRKGDTRVKRIKVAGGSYSYYLAKNEDRIDLENASQLSDQASSRSSSQTRMRSYEERDLHKLLSSYLKSKDVYSKTIFHEQSNGKDGNQIWTHPDIVGIQFLNLHTKASQNFIKSINRVDTFKLSSYELKKEINSDGELKKAFFQTVSNSSWANYGYLAAFEFSASLIEEMARLNQSFGIGIVELSANPYQSKILFPATYRDLDFKTIDKLCRINSDFEKFIEQIEKLLTASDRYLKSTEKELDEFCDAYFTTDGEIEKYCFEKGIPIENDEGQNPA